MGMCKETIEPIRPLHPHQINKKNTCTLVFIIIMKSNGSLTDFVKCLLFCSLDCLCGIEREGGREGERKRESGRRGEGDSLRWTQEIGRGCGNTPSTLYTTTL